MQEVDVEDAVNEDNQEGKSPKKEWQIQKKALITEKQALATSKEAAELLLADLEVQYQAALAQGDSVGAEALALQIEEKKREIASLQTQIKATIKKMQKSKYLPKRGSKI
jgi:hypothetical protein